MRTVRLVVLMALLASTACGTRAEVAPDVRTTTGASSAAPPSTPVDTGGSAERWVTRNLEASRGFLKITLKIPSAPAGAKALVINPNADEQALLASGIVVARYETDWNVIANAVKKTPDPEPAEKNVVGSWMLASPRVGIVGRRYVGFIDANAKGPVTRVIDTVSAETEIDPARIGMSGSSTHGFIVLEALLHEPRLTAAVVRSACGDYKAFLRASSLAVDDDPRFLTDGKLVLDADYDAELAAREPLAHVDEYPPRALLLLNGDADEAIPMACVEPTVRALDRAYRARGYADRFRSIVYSGGGHELGERAAADELAWWRRWLVRR